MTEITASASRIATARRRLADKLGELQRRGTRLRAALSPSSYFASPWLRVGLSVGLGYAFGRRPSTSTSSPDGRSSLLQAVVRSIVIVSAETAVRRMLTEVRHGSRSDVPDADSGVGPS